MLKSFWQGQPPLVRQVMALAYTALLTLMLLQSSSQPVVGPAAPPGDPDPVREVILTAGHVVGFGLLVLVWWWTFITYSGSDRALALAVIIGLVLSVVTELLQNFVPDRSASLFDLVVNTVVTLATAWGIQRYLS